MFCAKHVGILFVLFLILGVSAEAQSRLNFPRVLSADELATTGIALVNTSSSAVTATFSFYGTDGLLVTQAAQNVPAKGQLARLVSEIFPTVKTAGWVQIVSSSPELQGFEIVGDFSKVVDGAGPAAEGRQLALIDFSSEDVVHIVNTSSQSGTVQVTLNNAAGGSLGTRSIPLAPFQPTSLRLGDVDNDNSIDLVSLSADVNISAALTTKLPGGLDIGLTNAVVISTAPSTLFFPFAPNGPQGGSNWTTYLGISNLASTAQNISLTFTPDAGVPVTTQRTVAPGASVGDTVANLFGVSSSAFTAGWIRVNGSGALAGVAAYQDSANGSLAIVPSQSAGATAFFFGHIASLPPWYTGIALLNTTTTTASVEVYAIEGNGQLVGSVSSFSLAPGRRASLLSEFVPPVLQRVADGGWVFVRTTNSVPLLGFELFGHGLLPILANVQGFALPSGSTFTPPGTTSGSTADIQQVSTTDSSGTTKTAFVTTSTIVYVARVTNSGPRESAQLTFTVKDPRGNTMVTSTRTITLPTAAANFTFVSFIPTNALNGNYSLTGVLVHQGKTVTKTSTFSVSGGTTTPTVGQEIPVSASVLDFPEVAFRPGDTVRFSVITANFTSDSVMGVLNYQLTGPGLFNAGNGSVTYSVPQGISSRIIERVIPNNAQLGLFVFTSALTAGGSTYTKSSPITVVPANSSEAVEVDRIFVSDRDGTPRGGFTPGSSIDLNVRIVSTFGVTTPASIRYTVTDPDSVAVLEQGFAFEAFNGDDLFALPLNLSANAAAGTYAFRVTVTYQDNTATTKTSTQNTTFVVGNNPPPLAPTITTQRLFVADINGVVRSSFSNGEPFVFLVRGNYSTSPTPVPGTVLYQLLNGSTILAGQRFTTTFTPGISTGSILLGLAGITIPTGTTLTLSVTSSANGFQDSTNTSNFVFTTPDAPPVTFITAAESKFATPGKWMVQER